MGKMGCIVGVGALVLLAVVLGLASVGTYNGLVGSQENVNQAWAQVQNVYQRRADLVPNLVESVRGASQFEQDTLTKVIEARSRVGQISPEATAEILNDPQKFAQFQQAQDGLSSALQRLMVVVERYPELQSVAAFRDLMTQLEGTENRITVERQRFNEASQSYNARVRRVPASWFIGLFNWDFPPKAYFAATPGAETAPKVDFGTR